MKSLGIILFLSVVISAASAETTFVNFKSSCNELNQQDQKVVTINRLFSPTKVESYYTIVNVGPNEHDIYINYNLIFDRSLNSESQNLEFEYKEKIQACFTKYDDKLMDEKGRRIHLKVYNDQNDIAMPRGVSIKIDRTSDREDSRNYALNSGCEVIIHEALHLVGLVDEYYESSMKTFFSKKPMFNQRAIGRIDSIMHNTSVLYYSVIKHVLFSGHINAILYPNCESKNKQYYACARQAYKTSDEKKKSDVCDDSNWVIVKDE